MARHHRQDPTGLWRHKLIIKPKADGNFDADFLLEMAYQEGWDPATYINEVYNALHRHPTYSDQEHGRKCRCVWLSTPPENGIGCHLDIVPFITLPDGRRVIVNRATTTSGSQPSGPRIPRVSPSGSGVATS